MTFYTYFKLISMTFLCCYITTIYGKSNLEELNTLKTTTSNIPFYKKNTNNDNSLVGCAGFRTQTQGGWGANPNGNNPGVYLHANFTNAFPSGLTIGCNNTLVLNTAQDVTDFLPTGGPPSALPNGTLTNPTNYNNVLAAQVTAATLSVTFDSYDPNFGSSSLNLKDLIIQSGTFTGWTVEQLLTEANQAIGGCGSIYSFSTLNNAISSINQNYVDGTSNNGFLACPLEVIEVHVDPLCAGDNTGSIDLTVSGGLSPYTYLWSNGVTTEDLNNISAGIYTVTVTDNNGLTSTTSVTLTEPPALVTSIAGTDIDCNGTSTGSADLTVIGGTSPYTYSWSNGATTEDISNLSAGTYTVIITDANGCIANKSITINEPNELSINIVGTDVDCNGASTGSADLTVTGGTSPYTYSWSNGAITEDLSNVIAGSYTVTVTDANGCTVTGTNPITISEPTILSANIVGTDVACHGEATGSADLTVTGGTSPYTYLWSNGATTEDLNNLSVGTYTVTITDVNGCISNQSVTINEPTILAMTIIGTEADCNGASTGSADLTVSGGTSPYTYLWSNGATTEDLSNISAGTYTVTVSDVNGCTTTGTNSVTITEPTLLSANIIGTDIDCNGASTGSADLTVSGGTSPYTYSWSNGATIEDLSNISAGTYTVTITDVNGCITNQSVTINEPAILAITVAGTDIDCNGNITGSADLTVMGGTSPYTYSWSNGATTEDLNNLSIGTYTIIVTDANGCTTTSSVVITEPTSISSTLSVTNVTSQGGNDGSITANPSGGTAPYTYLWSNGQTTQTISGLSAGTYTVTVTDANGCPVTGTASISQPSICTGFRTQTQGGWGANPNGNNPGIYLHANFAGAFPTGLSIGCNNTLNLTSAQAVTDFLPTGSSPSALPTGILTNPTNYNNVFAGQVVALTLSVTFDTYDPNFGSSSSNLKDLVVQSGTFAGWTVEQLLTEANQTIGGCASNYSFSALNNAISNINQNYVDGNTTGNYLGCSLDLLKVVVNPLCAGDNTGSIDLTVSGGTAPYTYSWSNGATTEDLTGLSAGTYSVTVTDVNGLSDSTSVTITAPNTLSATITSTDIDCNGNTTGSADLTVNGGTSPYTYSWSNGATTEDLNNLSAGTYIVTITDVNGCDITKSITIIEPTSLSISIVGTNVDCKDNSTGSADLTVSGGTTPYTFAWSNSSTTEDLNNLSAGTYNVTVTDANNCTATTTVTITEPLTALSANIIGTDVACHGASTGSADLTVSGGTSPYTYSWSNGATTEDLSNLSAGTYIVTITDANGCDITKSVTIIEPTSLSISIVGTNVDCKDNSTGNADLTVSGGTTPYNFAWSNGTTTEDLNNLSAGTYNVTVTDANNCTATTTVTITEPLTALSANIIGTDVDCHGASIGNADLTVSGGTTPYTFAWSNGATTEDLNNLTAGTYNVTVTDANGCTVTSSVTISEPTALTASATTTDITCSSSAIGGIDVMVSGGTTPYTYSWSNGAITEDLSNIGAGTYSLTITDANNCSTTLSATVTQSASLTASIIGIDVDCHGASTGSADLTVSGGTSPYTYLWSNGATTEDLSNISGGTYTVTITDDNGCIAIASIILIHKYFLYY